MGCTCYSETNRFRALPFLIKHHCADTDILKRTQLGVESCCCLKAHRKPLRQTAIRASTGSGLCSWHMPIPFHQQNICEAFQTWMLHCSTPTMRGEENKRIDSPFQLCLFSLSKIPFVLLPMYALAGYPRAHLFPTNTCDVISPCFPHSLVWFLA